MLRRFEAVCKPKVDAGLGVRSPVVQGVVLVVVLVGLAAHAGLALVVAVLAAVVPVVEQVVLAACLLP